MGKQLKAVFSDPFRSITAISTFGLSEEIGASARALNVPGKTVVQVRGVADRAYVYTGAAIAGGVEVQSLSNGAFLPGGGGFEAAESTAPAYATVVGETGGGHAVLVSNPPALEGTSIQHAVLDTSLYAPGDVAGPIVDLGPGTELTATYPEGVEALKVGQAQWELNTALEGGGGGLTLSNPSSNEQSWLKQAAAAGVGSTAGSLVNRLFQKYVQNPIDQLLGLGPKEPEFGKGGGGGGGGSAQAAPYLNWLTIAELILLGVLIIGLVRMMGRR